MPADFSNTPIIIQSVTRATNLPNAIQTFYRNGKSIQADLALYTAGTDTKFNAALNTILTPAQRTEYGEMLAEVNEIMTNWEANHRSALGLPPVTP